LRAEVPAFVFSSRFFSAPLANFLPFFPLPFHIFSAESRALLKRKTINSRFSLSPVLWRSLLSTLFFSSQGSLPQVRVIASGSSPLLKVFFLLLQLFFGCLYYAPLSCQCASFSPLQSIGPDQPFFFKTPSFFSPSSLSRTTMKVCFFRFFPRFFFFLHLFGTA